MKFKLFLFSALATLFAFVSGYPTLTTDALSFGDAGSDLRDEVPIIAERSDEVEDDYRSGAEHRAGPIHDGNDDDYEPDRLRPPHHDHDEKYPYFKNLQVRVQKLEEDVERLKADQYKDIDHDSMSGDQPPAGPIHDDNDDGGADLVTRDDAAADSPDSPDATTDTLDNASSDTLEDASLDDSMDASMDTSAADSLDATSADESPDVLSENGDDDNYEADYRRPLTHKYGNIVLRKDAVARHECTNSHSMLLHQDRCHMTYFQGGMFGTVVVDQSGQPVNSSMIIVNSDMVTRHRCYDLALGSLQRCYVTYLDGDGDPHVDASPSPLPMKMDEVFRTDRAVRRKVLRHMKKVHRREELQLLKQHQAEEKSGGSASKEQEKQNRAEEKALRKSHREDEEAFRKGRSRTPKEKAALAAKLQEVAGSAAISAATSAGLQELAGSAATSAATSAGPQSAGDGNGKDHPSDGKDE